MLQVSTECARLIGEGARLHPRVDVTLRDGSAMALTGGDVMQGGLSVTHATSSSGTFDLGAAVMSKMTLRLDNHGGRLDGVDFNGAEMRPYVGPELADGTVEWVPLGVFYAEMPDTLSSTLQITAVDGLSKLEVPYSAVTTTYPATLREIVIDICDTCGLARPDGFGFDGDDYRVKSRPSDANLTCLQVLSHAAQASGNWARCGADGKLSLGWYDREAFDGEDWLDGGEFDGSTPYSTGDSADGGDFLDYSTGDTAQGGGFDRAFARLHRFGSLTLKSSDVQLTGFQVIEEDSGDEYGDELFWGLDGYVLSVVGNPLVAHGGQFPCQSVGARVVGPMAIDGGGVHMDGLTFRPFDCTVQADPTIEPGDPVALVDAAQRGYRSYVTNLTFTLGGREKLSCGAERSSKRAETSTRSKSSVSQRVKDEVKAEARERKEAVAAVESDVTTVKSDVKTVKSGLSTATSDISTLKTSVSGKADATHTHQASDVTSGTFAAARIPSLPISKVTNLQATLDGKAASSHEHDYSEITGTPTFALSGTTLYITTS